MQITSNDIDIKNLSSRKLLELLASETGNHQQRSAITRELRQRHRYLHEPEQLQPRQRH